MCSGFWGFRVFGSRILGIGLWGAACEPGSRAFGPIV